MNILRIILMVVQIIFALVLVFIVTVQSGKNSGLSGVIGGSSDSFLSKNKSATFDAKLSNATKWIAGAFILLTLVLNILPA